MSTCLPDLPAYLTSFVGREQELDTICMFLQLPNVRLLTLTGPGGVGKTRLAVQVAKKLLIDYKERCSFISLGSTTNPDRVFSIIAQAFGIDEQVEQFVLERLIACLHGRPFLLLLDNFEQVAGAALQLVRLLEACSELKILVTSRAVLHIQGEYEFLVSPLALPDASDWLDIEKLSSNPAVALFLQRAQAVQQGFSLTTDNAHDIVRICTYLDGLPLALELAAAQSKILPPQALARRLDQSLTILAGKVQNIPLRHQTLRRTIAWSYNLLDEQEQRLFRQLSIFTGGYSLEAAEAVCSALTNGIPVLDGIAALMNKSMLQQINQGNGEPHFRMLEILSLYGRERLVEHGELEITRCAHAHYYLELAERATSNLAASRRSINRSQPALKAQGLPVELTRREAEVLRLLAEGLTDALIAQRLVISRRTVNWYLTIIYSKIGVSCRSAATRYTLEHQLV